MKSLTVKIAAGSSEEFALVGDYVRIKSAAVPVRISADDGDVDATIEQGDALNLKRFQRIRVSHSDAADQTVTLMIGNGTSSDSAKVGGAVSVSSTPATAVPFAQSEPAVSTVSGQILAANSGRRFAMAQNNSAGGQNVFLNLAGGAATTGGVKLAPGASLVLDVATPSGAVNAIADAAGAVVVVVEG